MKTFKVNLSGTVKILIGVAFILSLFGIAFNVYSIISYSKISALKTATYCITLTVSLFIAVFILSLIFNCKYVIKNKKLQLCFGFINTKVGIDDIVSVSHFKNTDKLVVYFKTAEYSVIMILPNFYDEFIHAIKEINPMIIYEDAEENIKK